MHVDPIAGRKVLIVGIVQNVATATIGIGGIIAIERGILDTRSGTTMLVDVNGVRECWE